jgi:acetyltransferase
MPGVDTQALTNVLLRVSEMVCELPEIVEMDINPLVAHKDGVIALDARIRLERPRGARGRYGHMTICPYPHHLEREERLRDGSRVTIRPIRPEDARMEQIFVRGLSEEARYLRFMEALEELTPEMLARFTQIDYDREMAFVATTGRGTEQTEAGVARYVINAGGVSCDFAIVVADAWRGRGLATALMHALMTEARGKGLTRIESEVLSTNAPMLSLAKRLGFRSASHKDDPAVTRIWKKL